MEKINLLITLEQAEIITDALFSYKCEVKSRMDQAGVISDEEIASENETIHEIENNLLPVLESHFSITQ